MIRSQIPSLAKKLLDLPDCPVWIHEMELCRIIEMPPGKIFGHRSYLTCLLGWMENGCSDTNNGIKKRALAEFSREKRDHRISYQHCGRAEPFPAGNHGPVFSVPRWFRIGKPMADLSTQIQIVNRVGPQGRTKPGNYTSFLERGVLRYGVDSYGYEHYLNDFAYEFRTVWPEITARYTTFNENFAPKLFACEIGELEQIKRDLQMMVAASNRSGRLLFTNSCMYVGRSGRWLFTNSTVDQGGKPRWYGNHQMVFRSVNS
mmetsp:Transcript_30425/g.51875  ORF Transcript_30425/g.51875 Transcript_30425/m.51875 type:complete len:260 (+) Transcript_30425:765-1544(+)